MTHPHARPEGDPKELVLAFISALKKHIKGAGLAHEFVWLNERDLHQHIGEAVSAIPWADENEFVIVGGRVQAVTDAMTFLYERRIGGRRLLMVLEGGYWQIAIDRLPTGGRAFEGPPATHFEELAEAAKRFLSLIETESEVGLAMQAT